MLGVPNYFIPRLYNFPSFLGDVKATEAYQSLISLPILVASGTVVLCKT